MHAFHLIKVPLFRKEKNKAKTKTCTKDGATNEHATCIFSFGKLDWKDWNTILHQ